MSQAEATSRSRRLLPRYAVAGLAVMAASEAAMLLQVEPFWSWHTAIVWTGYILFVDGLVWRKAGSSWLSSAPREFAFLACVSVPLWLVFELYNLFIENWHYINLPSNPVLRSFGYGWSFATIWPAIFETSDLVACHGRRVSRPGVTVSARMRRLAMALGAMMLVWPIVWPSPYLAAPVWLGFILLLDPINARQGRESLLGDLEAGTWSRAVNLAAAGIICGVLWEFWNYWARAKWVYTVPIGEHLKIFEMPLPGYAGFAAFALECFTMYVFVRRLLWKGRIRPIGLYFSSRLD